MFRTKICGITRVDDARLCWEAGADAIGLNFFAGSPRCVDLPRAREIAQAVAGRLLRVGVFVNLPAAEVLRVRETVGLDAIQLHGDDPPEVAAFLKDCRLIRAFRRGPAGWTPLTTYLQRAADHGCVPEAILVDAHEPGLFGGTGTTLDWPAVAELTRELPRQKIILAGGLTPENVAAAIRAAAAYGVDAASGVETAPGIKDAARVHAFVQNAKAAFAQRAT